MYINNIFHLTQDINIKVAKYTNTKNIFACKFMNRRHVFMLCADTHIYIYKYDYINAYGYLHA